MYSQNLLVSLQWVPSLDKYMLYMDIPQIQLPSLCYLWLGHMDNNSDKIEGRKRKLRP